MASIQFAATCPKCGRLMQETYEKDSLAGFLKESSVPAYCVYCDHRWEIKDSEHLQQIREHLKR